MLDELDEMANYIIGALTLWLGTLSFIWRRHLDEDKNHQDDLEKRIDERHAQVDRALSRLIDAVEKPMSTRQSSI